MAKPLSPVVIIGPITKTGIYRDKIRRFVVAFKNITIETYVTMFGGSSKEFVMTATFIRFTSF